jgi:hypothetical protein
VAVDYYRGTQEELAKIMQQRNPSVVNGVPIEDEPDDNAAEAVIDHDDLHYGSLDHGNDADDGGQPEKLPRAPHIPPTHATTAVALDDLQNILKHYGKLGMAINIPILTPLRANDCQI